MQKRMIILGTGGSSVDILDTLDAINESLREPRYECVGFLDDSTEQRGKELHGVRVLGPLESAPEQDGCYFVNGISSSTNFWKKSDIIAKTGISDDRFETLIHPSASVSKMAELGRGTVVFQNVTVTSNVTIGRHVIILPNSVVSHDDVIGDYTFIAGGVCLSGGVTIGHSCYLGTNACVIEKTRIGDHCLIGMGSVVLQDIDDNSVVAGNPAKFLRHTRPDDARADS